MHCPSCSGAVPEFGIQGPNQRELDPAWDFPKTFGGQPTFVGLCRYDCPHCGIGLKEIMEPYYEIVLE